MSRLTRAVRLAELRDSGEYEGDEKRPTPEAVASAARIIAHLHEVSDVDIFPDVDTGGLELKSSSASNIRTVDVAAGGRLSARDRTRGLNPTTLAYDTTTPAAAATFLTRILETSMNGIMVEPTTSAEPSGRIVDNHVVRMGPAGPEVWAGNERGWVPQFTPQFQHRLDMLRSLRDGWDGEGGVQPDAAAIRCFEHALRGMVEVQRRVGFGSDPDGAVSIEWDDSDVGYVAAVHNGNAHLMIFPADGSIKETVVPADPRVLRTFAVTGAFPS